MEPQTTRQLLRNLQCTLLYKYLTLPSQKLALNYYEPCIPNPQHPQTFRTIYGIDCEMIETDAGQQIIRALIVEECGMIVYDKWFNVRAGTKVTDFITHITGVTQEILNKNAPVGTSYSQKDIEEIQKLIEGKILVGHDLANDLRMLKIKHNAFIDTVSLLPHNLGLPFKSKLKDLALTHLRKHIQFNSHNPIDDALTAVQIARDHIQDGRGTIQIEPFPQKKYSSREQMIKDAELDSSKFLLFVLRGSQALGLTIETADYRSDFDYVVVYDTHSTLDGRLIKLPNIDISFFDKKSFERYLRSNDISYLELFFLPKECIYINTFPKPEVWLDNLRSSLGFHLSKAKAKYKRIMGLVEDQPGYKWKIFKTIHMKMRFMKDFLQILELCVKKVSEEHSNNPRTRINLDTVSLTDYQMNLTELNWLWFEISKKYRQSQNFKVVLDEFQKMERAMKAEVSSRYPTSRFLRYRGHDNGGRGKNRRNAYSFERNFGDNRPNRRQRIQMIQSALEVPKEIPAHEKLRTIQILRQYGPQILEEYRVMYKRHRVYQNLIELHYLQSASFQSHPSRQCRGLIVDQDRNYQVVALPYYKFFDYNDPKYSTLDTFDFESAKVYQKHDGSIAFLYYYRQEWHVASSTVPDGLNNYCFARKQTTTEFKNEFWKIFNDLGFKLPSVEDKNKTFIFELMSKNHIIVVHRHESNLVLHGVRDIETLQEEDHVPYGEKYNWKVAKPIQIEAKNMDSILEVVNKMDPLQCEGYVLCDKNWNRIKVKNPGYVRINWLGELNLGFNKDPKKYILIEIVLSGEAQSFMNYCPQWKQIISEFMTKIKKLNKHVCEIYDPIKGLSKRQFARQVNKHSKDFQSLLFAVKGKQSRYYGKVQDVLNPKKFYPFINQYVPPEQ